MSDSLYSPVEDPETSELRNFCQNANLVKAYKNLKAMDLNLTDLSKMKYDDIEEMGRNCQMDTSTIFKLIHALKMRAFESNQTQTHTQANKKRNKNTHTKKQTTNINKQTK